MADYVTHKQLLEANQQLLAAIKTAFKEDIKASEVRLARQIKESREINTKHHLETRSMIGDLNRQFYDLRESLAKIGDSFHDIGYQSPAKA